ncbi:methylated-DNA--[protein]-cysteine S-methyltransferase [Schlegelella sp. S2-27]|uniref:Methylated-DNA--protein-cysteine methyltransferase n=1 Tax=Caldimonas mangrovi TaxID=2944811 RepID=A0ABT0YIH1_9BURK|nr:methylated-DNA--[protein]-cysteine S-methyltransferase [Caldimonas mangrovi]MCM5678224.1 methylated-DNA--[protein]-cysteine S-methyltransferase [Caldimonas mangrovi]
MTPRPYIAQRHIDSPLGNILLARTAQGLAGLWFEGQKDHPGTLDAPVADDDPLLQQTAHELDEYWRGQRREFAVPLDLLGTGFQRNVWLALLEVPLGATLTYRRIAEQVRSITATRAVGAAVGRNPVSIIVPCHRIIGSGGSLTGYAGGLERKAALLRLEGVLAI